MAASSPIVNTITQAARQAGVPPALALAIALNESGLNPHAVGDQGTSFGLYQLHQGGELGSLSPQQAFDPATNARVALGTVAQYAAKGAYGSPGALAAAAQRPANPQAYAQAVNERLPEARQLLGGGSLPAAVGSKALTAGAPAAAPAGDLRRQAALSLLANSLAEQNGQPTNYGQTVALIDQMRQPQAAAPASNSPASVKGATPFGADTPTKNDISPSLKTLTKDFGLTVTSGYRTEQHNTQVGGAPFSYHLTGQAIDVAPNQAGKQLLAYAYQHPQQFREVFYDPAGQFIKNGRIVKGAIGGHSDHIHVVLAS